jgi:hypothetical protein
LSLASLQLNSSSEPPAMKNPLLSFMECALLTLIVSAIPATVSLRVLSISRFSHTFVAIETKWLANRKQCRGRGNSFISYYVDCLLACFFLTFCSGTDDDANIKEVVVVSIQADLMSNELEDGITAMWPTHVGSVSSSQMAVLTTKYVSCVVEVEVTLRLTVSQSVCLGTEHPWGTYDQILLPDGMLLSTICSVITQWSESLRTRNP